MAAALLQRFSNIRHERALPALLSISAGFLVLALAAFAVPLALVWTALAVWLGLAQRSRSNPGPKTTTEGVTA